MNEQIHLALERVVNQFGGGYTDDFYKDLQVVKDWLREQSRQKLEIKITIEGGVLQNVEGLPEGWTYELNDLDLD